MSQQQIPSDFCLSVIGLGYVGLPIALEFAKKFRVIGFDINADRIALLRQAVDPSGEVEASEFENRNIYFTADKDILKKATFHIVAVPTPIDKHTQPDLKPLLSASKTVGTILKKGDVVVFESTVYPGCTEEDCVPILEQESGLKYLQDFKVGYSPERINPGDKEHTLTKITKVVAGCDAETLAWVAEVYGSIIEAGIHKAPSIRVAEAAKIIENTQRDLNISLMNELSMIFDRMNINTQDVLEAAGTKWNFLKFSPGLVGGHCIGVDPYYLTYKAKSIGIDPQVILSGRFINDNMAAYVAQKTVQKLAKMGKSLATCRVLVMGITFKENVSDIRNSKVVDLVKSLESYSLQVDVVDAFAKADELKREYGLQLSEQANGLYDAVVLAVPHTVYATMKESNFVALMKPDGVIIDIKGVLNKKVKNTAYWSL